MKIGYYHYYFKEVRKKDAPRICHDIRPILKNYLKYGDQSWKSKITTEDGEELLLVKTSKADVGMLVATRKQEIIKAIHKHTMTCVELSERLQEDESAGFAAYFSANENSIGLASTLRGPRTAALTRFVNSIIFQLGAPKWRMRLQAIGSSISVDQAKAMAYVARTSVKVSKENPAFDRLKKLFSMESDDIASFEIIVRNKKNKNLVYVFTNIANGVDGAGMEKMQIRAKAVVDEALADFYVDADGKLSEEIGTGSEKFLTRQVSEKFHKHPTLIWEIDKILKREHYEELQIPDLDRIGDLAHWPRHLQPDLVASAE